MSGLKFARLPAPPPPPSWQEGIEKALDESDCCVIFFGSNGVGPWQNEEMRSAIEERVSEKSIRVIPVLLPGTTWPGKESQLPRFLRRLVWVEFKHDWNEAVALHLLECGIKDIEPGRFPER